MALSFMKCVEAGCEEPRWIGESYCTEHRKKHSMDTYDVLAALVGRAQCKPGWTFQLLVDHGPERRATLFRPNEPLDGHLRLVITVDGVDAYNPEKHFPVSHWHPVPPATYNEASWRRWIFEQCRRVENHELGEWFRIRTELPEVNGIHGGWEDVRPFAPLHGPGEDPYTVHEYRPDVDRRTLQDGRVVEKLGE